VTADAKRREVEIVMAAAMLTPGQELITGEHGEAECIRAIRHGRGNARLQWRGRSLDAAPIQMPQPPTIADLINTDSMPMRRAEVAVDPRDST
jgi:hypothetical protein